MDVNGNVETVQLQPSKHPSFPGDISSREGSTFTEGVDISDSEIEAKAASSDTKNVPYKLAAKIRLGIDSAARNKIEKDLGTTVDNWLAEMFAHVQLHFLHSSLKHKINFEVCAKNYCI